MDAHVVLKTRAQYEQKIEFYLMAKQYGLDVKWYDSTVESLRAAILDSWR